MNHPVFIWDGSPRILFDDDTVLRIGEWDGVPAWSNGHVLLKGSPPEGIAGVATSFQKAIDKIPTDAPQIFPVAVCVAPWHNNHLCVFFSDRHLVARAQYLYFILDKYPDAEFFGVDGLPILVRQHGGSVAALMPIRTNFDEWPRGVKALLPEHFPVATEAR